jgi:hypothetical protein
MQEGRSIALWKRVKSGVAYFSARPIRLPRHRANSTGGRLRNLRPRKLGHLEERQTHGKLNGDSSFFQIIINLRGAG